MLICAALAGCVGNNPAPVAIGSILLRTGDEIMVAGHLVHTGTTVVLWFDADGYDAYRVDRRFVPADQAGWEHSRAMLDSPNRYGTRPAIEPMPGVSRDTGWTVATLGERIDQVVIHHDAVGSSQRCFEVLHDLRGLSAHFLIDLDGTIYQTLDLKERAWHATIANDRSIGIELANIGAYDGAELAVLDRWYATGADGTVRVTPPSGRPSQRTLGYVARPIREALIVGEVQGRTLSQYDFTPEQYEALEHLIAALCLTLPRIRCDYPRDSTGQLVGRALNQERFEAFAGILGHFHVQTNKIDPGPAFQWDRVIDGARLLMDQSQGTGR